MEQSIIVIPMYSTQTGEYCATARIRRAGTSAAVEVRWSDPTMDDLELFLLTSEGIRSVGPITSTAPLRMEELYGIAAMNDEGMCVCCGAVPGFETEFENVLVRLRLCFAEPSEEDIRRALDSARGGQPASPTGNETERPETIFGLPIFPREGDASAEEASTAAAGQQSVPVSAPPESMPVSAAPESAAPESVQVSAVPESEPEAGAEDALEVSGYLPYEPGKMAAQAGPAAEPVSAEPADTEPVMQEYEGVPGIDPGVHEVVLGHEPPPRPVFMPTNRQQQRPAQNQQTFMHRPVGQNARQSGVPPQAMRQSAPHHTEMRETHTPQEISQQWRARNRETRSTEQQQPDTLSDEDSRLPRRLQQPRGQIRAGEAARSMAGNNERVAPLAQEARTSALDAMTAREPAQAARQPAEQPELGALRPANSAALNEILKRAKPIFPDRSATLKGPSPKPPDQPDGRLEHTQRMNNPFPHQFPGSSWVKVERAQGQSFYLEGRMRRGREIVSITAVPGEYQPVPPRHLQGFKRYMQSKTGGYWIRIRKEIE